MSEEDTEWNDILRARGILPAKPKELEITEDELAELVEQSVKEHLEGKPLEQRTLDELDELEDLEDDRILESYRRQRLADIKAQMSAEKFGRVYQISKPDYTTEVTEASKTTWVVVHLFQDYNPSCKLLNAILDRLAERYKATKFCKIVADLCIPNYPDRNVPTILVYGEGDLKKQMIGMDYFGGAGATVASVETVLKTLGAVTSNQLTSTGRAGGGDDDDDRNNRDEDDNYGRRRGSSFSRVTKSSVRRHDNDDDDWD
ncbi:Proteolipid protein 2 [Polyrhizophydium stewartii]|uniref:Proteolipid protein 2 n=1 Tax=Polyrhizophydium stewartii TaxID=2732419 RepID=A0ABR4NFE6_9FUNG|nr:Phosducin-like protein 3 [Polyrhizophydium stewartii]